MLQHIHRFSNALAGFSESSLIAQLPVLSVGLCLGEVQVYADVGGHLHSVWKPANASADDSHDTHVLLLLGWSAYRV